MLHDYKVKTAKGIWFADERRRIVRSARDAKSLGEAALPSFNGCNRSTNHGSPCPISNFSSSHRLKP